jgi:hypothetical protein
MASTEKPMANTVSVESQVQNVLRLRGSCKSHLSDEVMNRIHSIRSICEKAEHAENNTIPWRNAPSHNNKHNSHPPNKWRNNNHNGPQNQHHNKPHPATTNTTTTTPPTPTNTTTTITTTTNTPVTNEKERGQNNRYISKFLNTNVPVETKILNQVILNKLNKFGAKNYDDVKSFLQQILDSDEKEFIHDFMLLVFKKAANEPLFCPLYAKLISELSLSYPQLYDELIILYNKYLDVFDDITEEQCKDYEEFVQRNREKFHRLGYSQFLGELTSLGILQLDHLKQLYIKILAQIKLLASNGDTKKHLVEEYVDCLVKMTSVFKNCSSENVLQLKKNLSVDCQPIMEHILSERNTTFSGLSKKAGFAIMDCVDIFKGK